MDAYPLTWPIGQPRVPPHRRVEGQFQIALGRARDCLLREVRLLGGVNVVISSNLEVRRDGLPYADSRVPQDPAVAVYFNRRVPTLGTSGLGALRPFVVACDQYRKVASNVRAVGLTIEAMRAIQRYGSSSLLERAFTGFAALPPASSGKSWWEVLGVQERATREQIRTAYVELSALHHPDVGGNHERMVEINAAYEKAMGA